MRITIDAHNDTLMKIIDPQDWSFKNNIGEATDFHIDLDKMTQGETNVALFAAYTDDMGDPDLSNSYLLAMMSALDETAKLNPERFMKAKTVYELKGGLAAGKRLAIQTIEGGYALTEANAKALLEQYLDIGVRMMTLVWDHSNHLGEGTLKRIKAGDQTRGGLTPLGKKVVGWMEENGIIVDVSHMDEETFWSTVAVARKPLVASHSGAHAVLPHVRNLKDEQLKAVADSGGVVCAVFCRYFIGDETSGVDTLLDHIEHMIKVAGENHVGLGSDFDGATMPVDLPDISHMQLVAKGLSTRGYSEEAIDKIMGGNLLRVISEIMPDDSRMRPERHMDAQSMIIFDGVRISLDTFDVNPDVSPKVWVNGIDIPCRVDQSDTQNTKIVCESEQIPNQRFFIVTIAYENVSGNQVRQTSIIKHPKTSE